ncbi:hypothetical protein BDM02DRAFT_1284568 [Thelephora ganbajun]|uniref:Uncharacterized protein n=1 Tax=Thelephora ganbajun TaxID=370292 RepID=A0ACB6ZMM2_THEGA|nr:hypothetical protein BDM02DRAFT_1284568 [Thelephora ganbajun]
MSYLLSPSLKSNHTRKESRRRRIQDHGGPCLSPSRHWEVELWRRSQSITSRHSESSIPASSDHPNISPSFPTLPSSPTAFVLNVPLSPPGPYGKSSIVTPRHRDRHPEPASSHDLDQLRLIALTELQKSVVEKGEGFVDKMRDWETHREREAMAHRGLKRSRSMMAHMTSDPMDDSADVMILDSPPDEEVCFWGSPRKKRAFSVDIVDALDTAPSETTPPVMTDDDTESCSRDSISAVPPSDPPSYPDIPSSCSDKAVSALALAFANGACGINDYQAVLDAYNHTHYGEESHVGELWD